MLLIRRSFAHILLAAFLLCAVSSLVLADSSTTKTRTVTQLADGVYAIRHPDSPDTFPQGTTTVIIGQRYVLVVDSCYLPSSAREDIAQIRQWTKLPVRYLLNTHWHYDHTMGNSEYRDAFPGLEIIAHQETQKQIVGFNPGWLERFPTRGQRLQQLLDAGKNANGKPYTQGEIDELKTAIAGIGPVAEEYKKLNSRLADLAPNVSFDRELTLDLGGREVQLKFLGRGNTAGDAVAFLPKEKIAIVGDLVDHPIPYLGGGFPVDQITTLQNLGWLNPQIIVPGHGDVLHGAEFLNLEIDFLQAVVGAIDKAEYDSNARKSPEDMQKAVEAAIDVAAWRRKFAGDEKDDIDFFNDFSFTGVVKAAYYQMNGR
jgi:glyoxylase-like metal-dependent hydrolase (beta-lactamase superfamily II)